MLIERDGDNFYLTYEPDYDPVPAENTIKITELLCLICNSMEMDFGFDEGQESHPDSWGWYLFHNFNVDKDYCITPDDAENFYEGRQILLCPYE